MLPFLKPAISTKKGFKVLVINGLAILAILFISVYFLILPVKNENSHLKQVKAKNDSVLARQQIVISEKDALIPKIQRLNTAIPNDPQILKLGSTIQTITVKSGMLLKSLSFNDSSKAVNGDTNLAKPELTKKNNQNKNIATVVFKVVLVGGDDGFRKFLQAVENSLRLIDVFDMKIPEQRQDDGSNNTYTLELNAYYLPSIN